MADKTMDDKTIPRFPETRHPRDLHYFLLRTGAAVIRFFAENAEKVEIKKEYKMVPEGIERTRVMIPARDGGRMIKADRYEKKGTTEDERKGRAVHLNFHGSGFVLEALGTDSRFCSYLASQTTSTHTIYDVDYRKSPETPFPGALNDALDVAAYLLDPARSNGELTVSGFSAGANLAMSLALSLPAGRTRCLLGFYGNADIASVYPAPFMGGKLRAGRKLPQWLRTFFYDCHIHRTQPRDDPRLSPIRVENGTWPKHVWVCCGEGDNLWESGKRLVDKLRDEGVEAEFVSLEEYGHAFDKAIKGVFAEETTKRVLELYEEAAEKVKACS